MTRRAAAVALVLLLGGVAAGAAEYEVGPGDKLRIEVVGRPEMTDIFEVDAEGMINYWEVGRVKASGHTVGSLSDKLRTLLVEGRYMRRPQVRVSIAEYGSQKVYVAGEVQRQGYYALKADRSLRGFMSDVPLGTSAGHEVIVVRPASTGVSLSPSVEDVPVEQAGEDSQATLAGGSPDAREDDEHSDDGEPGDDATAPPAPIEIPGLPPIDPSNEVLRVNMLEIQVGGLGHEVVLQSGDTVFVPRAAQIYVTGAVGRPGAFRYEPGMTVLQALTLAGGVTPRGSEGRAKVIRIEGDRKVERKVKPTDTLQPEDRLEVPERFF